MASGYKGLPDCGARFHRGGIGLWCGMNGNTCDDIGVDLDLMPILFELRNSSASSVCVAGSFNGWNPSRAPLKRDSSDHWGLTLPLAEGSYEYCMVVDGRWMLDPLNQLSVDNPFGGRNSVFTVLPSRQRAHDRDAERQIMSGAVEEARDQLRKGAAKSCEQFATPAPSDSSFDRTPLGPQTA